MASRRSNNETSNTGLIVTLVFFVLATIGLGVGTYMGFSGKADAEKAAKSANDAKTQAENKMREEQAVKLALLVASGSAQDNDLRTFNGLRGTYTAAIQTQVGGLKHIPRWDVANQGDRPPKTYDAMIDELQRATNVAASQLKAKDSELQETKKNDAAAIQELQNSATTAKDNLTKANANVVAEQNKKGESFVADQGRIDQLSKEVEQLKLEKQNMEVDLTRKMKALQEKLDEFQRSRTEFGARVGPILEKLEQAKAQRPEFRELGEFYDVLSRQFERAQALANDTPKGEISRVDRSSGTVYVNLGSADFVKPQLTFSVLPAGSTGKAAASRERKGAIEIVQILEPHLSTAKVIDAVSPIRDPLMKGDLLFNPVWSPSQHEHVAIVGIIDLNGDGIDDTPDLIRALEKQGVVVDAYLDLKTRTIKGPGMTEKTTYLILGEQPMPPSIIQENNPVMNMATEVIGKIAEIKAKAKDLGVESVQYRRFLALIGYRLPKMLPPSDYSLSSYLKGVSGPTKPGGDGKDDRPK